ncbi:MAG: hypothetical protein Q8O67_02880 [Deltaproteobacteria bacterium]|nr:hypothetical protein [Deltaproteobacteria bacterium]
MPLALLVLVLAAALPDTPDAHEAARLYGELDYETAEPLFRKVAAAPGLDAKTHATALLWLALCQAGVGELGAANESMKQALDLDPEATLPAEVGPSVQGLFDDARAQPRKTASAAAVVVETGSEPLVVAEVPATKPAAAGLFGGPAGVGLSVRGDISMLNARTFGVTAGAASVDNALAGEGIKGFGGGVLLQAAWHLPLEGSALDRVFGIELDAGYSLSGTNGEIAVQQYESVGGETKLVTTTYGYEGLLHSVPISLGARARLPLDLPVHIDLSTGGLAVWGSSSTTSTLAGSEVPFSQDNFATDFAWGFYAEGGIALALGVGELTAAYRYQSAYLDFDHPEFNPTLGDLGGHHVVVGYRFLL